MYLSMLVVGCIWAFLLSRIGIRNHYVLAGIVALPIILVAVYHLSLITGLSFKIVRLP